MDTILHEFSICVRVFSKRRLYGAALARCHKDKVDNAVELLKPDGEIDTARCLQMLLDPGESPPGCEIIESTCE